MLTALIFFNIRDDFSMGNILEMLITSFIYIKKVFIFLSNDFPTQVSVVSGDMMCLLWQQMVRYRFILHTFSESNPLNPHPIAHSTHYTPTPHAPPLHVPLSHVTVFTIQQVLPATSVSYKFTVSLIGVKFLS